MFWQFPFLTLWMQSYSLLNVKKQFQFFCWFHYVWDSAAAAFLLSLRGMKYLRPQKQPKLWNIFWTQKQPKLPNGNKESWSRNYICITFDFIAIFNKKHSHNRGGRLTSFMRCLLFSSNIVKNIEVNIFSKHHLNIASLGKKCDVLQDVFRFQKVHSDTICRKFQRICYNFQFVFFQKHC